jgi:hypothetical protein
MSDFRSFQAPGVDVMTLARSLAGWLQQQQFEVQSVALQDGIQVQARQAGGWRKFTGTSAALNISIRRLGDALNVDVGAGQWGDKAAAGAVGMFLLWPLAFTAAYGAWQQNKLPERVFEFIDRFIATGGAMDPLAFTTAPGQGYAIPGGAFAQPPSPAAPSMPAASPPPPAPLAGYGGAAAGAGTAAAVPSATACPSCGTALPPGAVFCLKCGTRVA